MHTWLILASRPTSLSTGHPLLHWRRIKVPSAARARTWHRYGSTYFQFSGMMFVCYSYFPVDIKVWKIIWSLLSHRERGILLGKGGSIISGAHDNIYNDLDKIFEIASLPIVLQSVYLGNYLKTSILHDPTCSTSPAHTFTFTVMLCSTTLLYFSSISCVCRIIQCKVRDFVYLERYFLTCYTGVGWMNFYRSPWTNCVNKLASADILCPYMAEWDYPSWNH